MPFKLAIPVAQLVRAPLESDCIWDAQKARGFEPWHRIFGFVGFFSKNEENSIYIHEWIKTINRNSRACGKACVNLKYTDTIYYY